MIIIFIITKLCGTEENYTLEKAKLYFNKI